MSKHSFKINDPLDAKKLMFQVQVQVQRSTWKTTKETNVKGSGSEVQVQKFKFRGSHGKQCSLVFIYIVNIHSQHYKYHMFYSSFPKNKWQMMLLQLY